jgi:hypothetical protein
VGKLERLKQSQFDDPLAAAIDGAKGGRGREGSPVVEGLAAAVSDPAFSGAQRRLVLVSDLLQFTEGYSLYAPGADWARYRESPGALRNAPDLTGVNVRVVQLERRDRGELQEAAREKFWRPYFEDSGATVTWDR